MLPIIGIINDNGNDNTVWLIVGVLAIIALLIYIVGRFPHR
jgi:hypothetical protein